MKRQNMETQKERKMREALEQQEGEIVRIAGLLSEAQNGLILLEGLGADQDPRFAKFRPIVRDWLKEVSQIKKEVLALAAGDLVTVRDSILSRRPILTFKETIGFVEFIHSALARRGR